MSHDWLPPLGEVIEFTQKKEAGGRRRRSGRETQRLREMSKCDKQIPGEILISMKELLVPSRFGGDGCQQPWRAAPQPKMADIVKRLTTASSSNSLTRAGFFSRCEALLDIIFHPRFTYNFVCLQRISAKTFLSLSLTVPPSSVAIKDGEKLVERVAGPYHENGSASLVCAAFGGK